jgi:hypothetical protein
MCICAMFCRIPMLLFFQSQPCSILQARQNFASPNFCLGSQERFGAQQNPIPESPHAYCLMMKLVLSDDEIGIKCDDLHYLFGVVWSRWRLTATLCCIVSAKSNTFIISRTLELRSNLFIWFSSYMNGIFLTHLFFGITSRSTLL